ncbi:hypothetical protein AVEN_118611-1 [Araneus ventricosus]|uniref:Uncharacterized protein n=1 Tax=Araneus ventricosus TaxID=182803 RepID=A0A4Y2AVX3_ARAVE|nr:hypothetical protein AVEN_118611-1 [Araneus ventricosus]
MRRLMSWPKRQLRPRRQQCSRFPFPKAVQNKISSSELWPSGRGVGMMASMAAPHQIITKVGLRNHNWPRQLIQFIREHGPFPSYLFRFGKHPDNCCACGEAGTPFRYATKYRLALSYHLRCPADQRIEAWLKSITNHRLIRNKIIDLLNFITSQEDLLKSEQPE